MTDTNAQIKAENGYTPNLSDISDQLARIEYLLANASEGEFLTLHQVDGTQTTATVSQTFNYLHELVSLVRMDSDTVRTALYAALEGLPRATAGAECER